MPAGILKDGALRPGVPDLSPISLVAVTSISLPATVRALEKSAGQADFGTVLLLSDQPPSRCGPEIEWRRIRPISSREDYSRFMLQQLADQIQTDFALCIQWDGYVLDGRCWKDEFFEYDYIGAPWPHFDDGHRVGNGGFSLRSKRLMEACTRLPIVRGEAEDIAIGRTHRDWLEKQAGIRFAPEEIARSFAFERLPRGGAEFGFHGVFNMRSILGRSEFRELLGSLDPGSIGRLETREIFWQSLADADIRSAYLALRNGIPGRSRSRPIHGARR